MTLQTSGQITLTNIKAEFGGTVPYRLSDYYPGGAYVPVGTSGTNGAVPVFGQPLSLSDFYGTSNYINIGVSVSDVFGETSGTNNITRTMSAVVTGGDGSHTYSWVKISGDSNTNISGSSTGSTVNILCTTPGSFGSNNATFRCTVNDGTSSASDDASGTFIWGDLA